MADFLEWSEQQHAARPRSHQRYVTSSKALLRYFGDMPIDRILSDDVEKFKVWRARQKKAAAGRKSKRTRHAAKATKQLRPATINRELACLKHLFTRNDDLVPQNPVRKVKMLDEDNLQLRVLTHEEEMVYLMACSQPLRDIAILMLDTGMRPEEVCRIRRENVHLDQGYVFNPFGKTKAARRKLWLSEQQSRSIDILTNRLAKIKGDYLFPGRVEGKSIVKVNAAHTSAVKRSKVSHFTLYSLRHTFATRMAESDVDIVTLAAILGHSKLAMVLRYCHPSEQHQAAAMLRMKHKAAM